MRNRSPCLLVIVGTLLLASVEVLVESGIYSGSGSGYKEEEEICIKPTLAPSLTGQAKAITEAVLLARCLAICLQEQQVCNNFF